MDPKYPFIWVFGLGRGGVLGWFGRGLGPPEAATRTLDEQRSARRSHFFLRPPSAASFWALAIEVMYFQMGFQIWGVPTPPYPPLPPRGGPDLMGHKQSYRVIRLFLPYAVPAQG